MGNCGVGFAPAAPDRHEWLIELMEGVEDIPGTALTEGITWEWESFPEYLDALERDAAGARRRRADRPRPAARLRDGRPRRGQRAGDRRRHRRDGAHWSRRRCEPARSASPPAARRSTGPRTASWCPAPTPTSASCWASAHAIRRAGHGVFQFAPDHARVPGRRVAVDATARGRHRPAGQRQPQPARRAPRTCGARCSACSTRPTPTGCRSSPRSPAAPSAS